ncbi:phosphatase PAP2 family protein [Rathayibacter sp. VKM Ac-2856]|uniref:phosphatase PAP2 family protein n=1 Tax=unclassified Rathayibacter TaxID=2609250 RepID=UPI001565B35D|nr:MULTISPECIES: phosphatase PAP2 family protein [unclassified Rathayibacter]NQX03657.1 phosphatase PAP2 family protein [Rathayibacter sp. VKM Ac-2858]NQX18825.1 phosphatase PAP2 family protein [Rathayibacter sp. VKM Ac-2856]
MSTAALSPSARFHQRFLVEQREMTAPARRRLMRAGGGSVAVGLVLFAALIVQVATDSGLAALDPAVSEWFRAKRFAEGTVVMDTLATVFGPVFLPIIILGVLVLWIALARHLWRPLLLAGGMVTGMLSVQLAAHLVQRMRPPVEYMLLGADGTFSFPSGHVTGVSDFFLITTFLLASRRSSPIWAIGGFALSLGMIAGQVVARLYLGYHWLTDTLASVALALVMLGSVVLIDTWRTARVRPASD